MTSEGTALRAFPGAVLRCTLLSLAIAALALPALAPFGLPPSPTALNQAVAWLGWGAFALVLCFVLPAGRLALGRGLGWLLGALALYAACALAAPWWNGAPWGLSVSSAATVLAAGVVAAAAAQAAAAGMAAAAFRMVGAALLVAGVASAALGVVQIYLPSLADGELIAAAAGRAAGNLRQPNHLATFLVWSIVAAVWAGESKALPRGAVAALAAFLLFGVVLSGSRTGALCVALLAGWGALDRALSRPARSLLIGTLPLYALLWWLLGQAAGPGEPVIEGSRLATMDPSRPLIWADTLALIAAHPWLGTGVNGFNLAWTLTPSAQRHPEYFDHAHDLPLHLLAELGVPLGGALLLLLGAALWAGWRNAIAAAQPADEGLSRRAALVIVLVIGLHSLLEYPLWYAYFLFPTAFFFGLCLGGAGPSPPSARGRAEGGRRVVTAAMGALVVLGGLAIVIDYSRVAAIFVAGGDAPLDQRIAQGRRSWLFAHHADYALVTSVRRPETVLGAFERPVYYLLDARLATAWAKALEGRGLHDHARWLAQRLREFRRDDVQQWFAPCRAAPPPEPLPFQCQAPSRTLRLDDFR